MLDPTIGSRRDFETLESGLQFKDAKVGTGTAATNGDRVVMDWEGYTIGESDTAGP